MSPQLSVVVPVHDVAPWIGEQLDCILRQRVDLEVLVVDDRSTDGTRTVVEAIAAQDDRVRVLASPTNGGAAARNFGIDAARGAHIVFADGDDLVPDGAYAALLDAIEETGAPIAIGRHLKFSSGATWEPMSSWYAVDESSVTDLDEMPVLLANRACWNRAFRTDFLRARGIRFPEVPRSNDIVPMVRALVAADRVAVVPSVVYLYRERPGASSMTARSSGVDGVLSYIEQEIEVAGLLATSSTNVRRTHSRVVLEADGYVHLERFLRSRPTPADTERFTDAVTRLLATVPTADRESVRAERRILWHLVATGSAAVAVELATRSHDERSSGAVSVEYLRAWADALEAVRPGDAPVFPLDRAALVDEGLFVLLANRAEHTDRAVLEGTVEQLASVSQGVAGSTEVLRAVSDALHRRDPEGIRSVSVARHLAPVVVDAADATTTALVVRGPLATTLPEAVVLQLVATGPDGRERPFAVDRAEGRWQARIANDEIGPGRHGTAFRVGFGDLAVTFPVVVARMPLPPVAEPVQLQPLADRADGRRFVIDRRSPRPPLLRRLVRAAGRAVRRA